MHKLLTTNIILQSIKLHIIQVDLQCLAHKWTINHKQRYKKIQRH